MDNEQENAYKPSIQSNSSELNCKNKEMKGQKANMLLKDTALNQNPDLDSDTLEIQPMLTVWSETFRKNKITDGESTEH